MEQIYESAAMAGVATMGAFMAIYAVLMVFGIAMYVLEAVALMKMAKKTGVANGWLAFIPIASTYILGRVSDAGTGKRARTKMLMITTVIFLVLYGLLVGLMIAAAVSSPFADTVAMQFVIPMLVVVLAIFADAICLTVFTYIAFYHIADNFGGENGVLYFVGFMIGTFFMPIVSLVLMLILAGKQPKRSDAPIVLSVEAEPKTDSVF